MTAVAGHSANTTSPYILAGLLPENPEIADVEKAHDQLVSFLDTAPVELQEWAQARVQAADAAVADFAVRQVVGEDALPSAEPVAPATEKPVRSRRGLAAIALLLCALLGVYGVYQMGGPAETGTGTPSLNATPTADASTDAAAAERVAALRETVAKNPRDVDARLSLGVALFNQLDLAGAEQQWLEVTKLQPEQAAGYFNLGFLYLSKTPADNAKAKQAWDKVIELEPNSQLAATAKSHLARLSAPAPSASATVRN